MYILWAGVLPFCRGNSHRTFDVADHVAVSDRKLILIQKILSGIASVQRNIIWARTTLCVAIRFISLKKRFNSKYTVCTGPCHDHDWSYLKKIRGHFVSTSHQRGLDTRPNYRTLARWSYVYNLPKISCITKSRKSEELLPYPLCFFFQII